MLVKYKQSIRCCRRWCPRNFWLLCEKWLVHLNLRLSLGCIATAFSLQVSSAHTTVELISWLTLPICIMISRILCSLGITFMPCIIRSFFKIRSQFRLPIKVLIACMLIVYTSNRCVVYFKWWPTNAAAGTCPQLGMKHFQLHRSWCLRVRRCIYLPCLPIDMRIHGHHPFMHFDIPPLAAIASPWTLRTHPCPAHFNRCLSLAVIKPSRWALHRMSTLPAGSDLRAMATDKYHLSILIARLNISHCVFARMTLHRIDEAAHEKRTKTRCA